MTTSLEASLPLYEDALDMLADVVRQLGGAKKVGPVLRPSLPVDQAAQWVRDCVNRERRERFDPEQVLHILRLARDAGVHSGKHWLDDELGYERGRPVTLAQETDRTAAALAAAAGELRSAIEALERIQNRTSIGLASVKR